MSAHKRVQADRWRIAKGMGFWAFMMAACFIFGLLVVSPLINVAGGGTRTDNKPTRQAATITPAHKQSSGLPIAPPRENRGEETIQPDIRLTPDKEGSRIQRPDSVDR